MYESVIDNWFTYHAPSADQVPKYEAIRAHGREFAHVINNLVPDSADKTHALRTLREVVMWANAAIATEVPEEGKQENVPSVSVGPAHSPYQTTTGFRAGGLHAKPEPPTATLDDVVASFVGKLNG